MDIGPILAREFAYAELPTIQHSTALAVIEKVDRLGSAPLTGYASTVGDALVRIGVLERHPDTTAYRFGNGNRDVII